MSARKDSNPPDSRPEIVPWPRPGLRGVCPQRLSARELEVLRPIAEGRGRKEISKLLNIIVRTLDTHRTNIMTKLGCRRNAELVHQALRANLVKIRPV